MDFAGYDQFVALTNRLKANELPTDEDFASLFRAPGYDAIVKSERQATFVRQLIRLAFRPGDAAERDEVLAAADMKAQILKHLMRYRERTDELDAWRRRLLDPEHGGKWLARAIEQTLAFLPPDLGARRDPSRLEFIAYNADGTANADAVIIDLLTTLDMGEKKFRAVLAHELHHVYASRLTRIEAPNESEPSYFLFHALDQLQLEGIADQIDKRAILDADRRPSDPYGGRYFDAMQITPAILRRADALIVEFGTAAAAESPRAGEIARTIFGLFPFAGHPNGGFMAQQIRKASGTAALISTIGSPFDFVRAYNAAARQSNDAAPPLTEPAMRVLAGLEDRLRQRHSRQCGPPGSMQVMR